MGEGDGRRGGRLKKSLIPMLSRFQRYFIMWFVLLIFPVLPLAVTAYSFQLCNRFWFWMCILVVQFRENVLCWAHFGGKKGKNQGKRLENLSPVWPQQKARTFQEFHWQRKLCFLGVIAVDIEEVNKQCKSALENNGLIYGESPSLWLARVRSTSCRKPASTNIPPISQ